MPNEPSLEQLIEEHRALVQSPVVPPNPFAQAGTILGGFGASATGGINRPLEMFGQQREQQVSQQLQSIQLGMQLQGLRQKKEEGHVEILGTLAKSDHPETRTYGVRGLLKVLEGRGAPIPQELGQALLYGNVTSKDLDDIPKLVAGGAGIELLQSAKPNINPKILQQILSMRGRPEFYTAFGIASPEEVKLEREKNELAVQKARKDLLESKYAPAHVTLDTMVQELQDKVAKLGASHPDVIKLRERVNILTAKSITEGGGVAGLGGTIAAGGPSQMLVTGPLKPPEAVERKAFTEATLYGEQARQLYEEAQKYPGLVPSWGQRASEQETIMGLRPRNLPLIGAKLPQMTDEQRRWYGAASLTLGFIRKELIGAAGTVSEAHRLLAALPDDPKAMEPYHLKLIAEFYDKYGDKMRETLKASRRQIPEAPAPVKIYRGSDGKIRKVE